VDAPAIVAKAVAQNWSSEGTAEDVFYLSDRTDNFLRLAKLTFGIDAQWELKFLHE
jgi:hypothetical protein